MLTKIFSKVTNSFKSESPWEFPRLILMNCDISHIWRDEKMISTKSERHKNLTKSVTLQSTTVWVMTFWKCICTDEQIGVSRPDCVTKVVRPENFIANTYVLLEQWSIRMKQTLSGRKIRGVEGYWKVQGTFLRCLGI